jgi:hypothetical protein
MALAAIVISSVSLLIAAGENSREADLARAALAMLGEIGGL